MIKVLFLHEDKNENLSAIQYIKSVTSGKANLITVTDVSTAMNYITLDGPFSILIIDADNMSYDPIEFAGQTLDFIDEPKFIFLGNENALKSRVPEVSDDFSQVKTVLTPFTKESFEEPLVDYMIELTKEEEAQSVVEGDLSDFSPLKLRSFYLFKSMPANVFIKISKKSFMKVFVKGQSVTDAQLLSLSKRGVKNLFLHHDDYIATLENSILECYINLDKYKKPSEVIEYMLRSIGVIQAYIRVLGIGQSINDLIGQVITKVEQVFDEVGDLNKILDLVQITSGDSSEKSILASFVGMFILEKLKFKSSSSKSKIILSSIICDCTFENDDLCKINSITDPNLQMYNVEEQDEFQNHSIKASELASLLTLFPEVDFIVQQHHERPDGKGFPHGINYQTITLISAVFILSNTLATYIITKGKSKSVISSSLGHMKPIYDRYIFKESFKALENYFK